MPPPLVAASVFLDQDLQSYFFLISKKLANKASIDYQHRQKHCLAAFAEKFSYKNKQTNDSMRALINRALKTADDVLAPLMPVQPREQQLLVFMFHSLFANEREKAAEHIDPQQDTSAHFFRQWVERFLHMGYRFVSPQEVLAGLPTDGRYAMLTFDDGYYNNTLALPVLKEFGVSATFYISTDHVEQQKCYWWDALYRERRKQGRPLQSIRQEQESMKNQTTEQMEAYLRAQFGPQALRPLADIDRPLNVAELRDFAKAPGVVLGNHTRNHAILGNYSPQSALEQLESAQKFLADITGQRPLSIAYPNGNHNDQVVELCKQVGLQVGVTTFPEANNLPLPASLMRLSRLMPLGYRNIDTQAKIFASGQSLELLAKKWLKPRAAAVA